MTDSVVSRSCTMLQLLLLHSYIILPLFLFTMRSEFSQSQTLQSLTKYFEKIINI
jgi:hypothetical protein